MKQYGYGGLAGCVIQRMARQTRTVVGVYHAEQSGIDTDAGLPWTTVCETHHCSVAHATLRTALFHSSDPAGWCEACGEALDERMGRKNQTDSP